MWLCVGDVGGSGWCMDVVVSVGWHFVGFMVDCVDVVMGVKFISMVVWDRRRQDLVGRDV